MLTKVSGEGIVEELSSTVFRSLLEPTLLLYMEKSLLRTDMQVGPVTICAEGETLEKRHK